MEFVSQSVAPDFDQDRRRRRRGLIALLLGLSVLTVGSGVFSLAVFTSTDDTTGSFSTGTIVLDAEPELTFNATAIFPGDSGDQTVTVTNSGTGELRYAMSSSSVDPDGLGDELDLVITEGACPGSGATLWDDPLNGAAFGSPTQGPDTGDRTLVSGGSEDLCFAWDLPLGTATSFQGTSMTITFSFQAEQTANNP